MLLKHNIIFFLPISIFICVFIKLTINQTSWKSNDILDNIAWDQNGCQALPNKAIKTCKENLWSDLTSVSCTLFNCFADSISDTVGVRHYIAWSYKLREYKLEWFSNFVCITKQSYRCLSVKISLRISNAFKICKSFQWICKSVWTIRISQDGCCRNNVFRRLNLPIYYEI